MRVKISGTFHEISRAPIEAKMAGAVPEVGRRYFATVGGRNFPVKQILSAVTGEPVVAIATNVAFSVLRKLGYEIIDAEKGSDDNG